MQILFITSNRLGDAVLSTGILDHIVREYPGAEITVACGALPASLFEGVPGLKRIIPIRKEKLNAHWFALWREVVGTRWDLVVDLRDSAVSRLVRAKQRRIFTRRIDKNLHKVEQSAAVLGLATPPSPTLWPTLAQQDAARALIPDGGPVLGIGPTANWRGKTWPAEKFIEVIRQLTAPSGILPHARVAIFAAPGEEETARTVLNSIPDDRRIDVIAKADPGTAAVALARCALYIGNDSGLMHCAAAAGVPTLGLFGPSWPHLYRPWGLRAAYVSTAQNFDELTSAPGYDAKTTGSLMRSLGIDDVIRAAAALFK